MRSIAPALVLLAGVVALSAERIPAALGWVIVAVGVIWLVSTTLGSGDDAPD